MLINKSLMLNSCNVKVPLLPPPPSRILAPTQHLFADRNRRRTGNARSFSPLFVLRLLITGGARTLLSLKAHLA